MADLDDLYAWLQGATFRRTSLDQRKMVERLIEQGRAEWVIPWNRARAIPNPVAKPKRDHKTRCAVLEREVAELRASLAWAINIIDHEMPPMPDPSGDDGEAQSQSYFHDGMRAARALVERPGLSNTEGQSRG
jgi:hypothetical protein